MCLEVFSTFTKARITGSPGAWGNNIMVKASRQRAPLYCSVLSVLHAWSHLGLLTACCHWDCSVPTSQGTMSQIQETVLKKLMSDTKGLQKSRFLFSLKMMWNSNRWITISAPSRSYCQKKRQGFPIGQMWIPGSTPPPWNHGTSGKLPNLYWVSISSSSKRR